MDGAVKSLKSGWVAVAVVALAGCGVKDDLPGVWRCQTTNPDGSVGSDEFTFVRSGQLSVLSDSMLMQGQYVVSGNKITMTITRIPGLAAYGYSTDANKTIHGDVKRINATDMVLETFTTSSTLRRSSACRRSK
jgi:hypothetical protein